MQDKLIQYGHNNVIPQKEESNYKLTDAPNLIVMSGSNAVTARMTPAEPASIPQKIESRAITMQEIIDKVIDSMSRASQEWPIKELRDERSNGLEKLFRTLLETKLSSLEAEERLREEGEAQASGCSKIGGGSSDSSSNGYDDISTEEEVLHDSVLKVGK